ncbi:MAG: peptidoglycan-binding protein [Candidatus Nomurabacteria bacterium]|nr:peptidoglycan-binding protein [Candidatus Nomurabacteria bacterium]
MFTQMRSHLKFLSAILFALVFLVGGFFVLNTTVKAFSQGDILISEFKLDGSQWVELMNTTNSDINLSSTTWTFETTEIGPGSGSTTLSGIIPAKGLLTFTPNTLSTSLNTLLSLKNAGATIYAMSYGNATFAISSEPSEPHFTGFPSAGQSLSTIDGITWSATSAPTKGWFNNAIAWTHDQLLGTGSPSVPPTLASIASDLSSGNGVVTNMGEQANPSAATDLYFEKRTDVNTPSTALGKISFAGPLNLTDKNTVDYLKLTGNKLDIQGNGTAYAKIGLNTYVSGTTESVFKSLPATITMYGLSSLGGAPALIVKNNNDAVIPFGDTNYPAIGAVCVGCGFNSGIYVFTTDHFTTFETGTTINTAAIAGVTAPATGGTPTATIADTTQYTATISWNGSPSTFAASTVYTATITITPKTSYTLTGVTSNFFTVAGATATNSVNSGVITAVFPATAADNGSGNTSYTLTYTAGTGGTITGTSPQTVNASASGTAVTAVPNSGYTFTSWSDGVNTASRTDTNIQANMSVTASFTASITAFNNPNYHYTNITNAPDGTKYRQAGFSPDGTKIVAVKQVGTSWEIYLMNADGSGQTRISAGDSGTGNIYEYTNPFWSDDGTVIGFAEVHNTGPNKIIAYNLSTATRSYIYQPIAPLDANNADFLGNSNSTIVFFDVGVGESRGADLFTWDGTTRTNITNTPDYYEYEPISNGDGTKIVYWSGEATAEPTNTTHTLTYSGGVWTKDVGFTPIVGSYWPYWTTPAATQIALTGWANWDGTVDISIYDNEGNFVSDLSGPGYTGGNGKWNFFGSMPQGSHGEFAVTSNAYRSDPSIGRDIIIATPPTTVWVCGTGDCGHSGYSYNTIQSGIDAVAIGGTVNIAEGNYAENIKIFNKSNLTISGAGQNLTTIAGNGTGIAIKTSSGITIKNLKIHTVGANKPGIWVYGWTRGGTASNNLTVQDTTIIVDGYSSGITGDSVKTTAHSGWLIGGKVGEVEHGNTIQINDSANGVYDAGDGIDLQDVTASEVSYNNITIARSDSPTYGNTNVLWSSEAVGINNLIFKNNTVNGSTGSQVAFLTDYNVGSSFVSNEDPNVVGTIGTITISSNTFDTWGSKGLRIGSGVSGVTVSGNKFLKAGLAFRNENASLITAENNYWGEASPDFTTKITTANDVTGAIDHDPWYINVGMTTTNIDLANAKTTAHGALTTALGTYTEGNYTSENWTTLTGFKTTGDTNIDAATNTTDVTSAQNTATSGMAGVIKNITGTVTISGATKFGQTLTANISGLTNAGTPTYQWKRGGSSINGATNGTYTLVLADINSTITVTTTAQDGVGTGAITSNPTGTITKADGASAPTAPTLASKTTTNITLNTISGNQFRNGSGSWQDSEIFSGLTASTTYTFTTKVKETATTLESAISAASASIITLEDTQTVPDTETGAVTINDTITEVVITNPTQAVTVNSGGTENATIDVSAFVDTATVEGETVMTGTLPEITINSTIADVEIPATTLVTGPASWNGVIDAPTSGTPTGGNAPAGFSVGDTVITVGSPDGTLTFDNAVILTLPGVTGTVGYRPSGSNTWTQITSTCGGTYANPTDPIAGGECSINNGTDTKIVTFHFTSFGELNTVVNHGNSGGYMKPATPAVPANITTPDGCAAGDKFSTTTGRNCNAATPAIGKVLGAEKFIFTKFMKNGSKGSEIIELQKFLTTLGYTLTADGKFGPKTKGAVIKFQIANSLKGDGVIGALTRAALNK